MIYLHCIYTLKKLHTMFLKLQSAEAMAGRGLLLLHQLQQRGGGGGGGGVIQPAVPGPPPALAQLAVHAALAQVEVAEEAVEPEQ